MAKEVVRSQNLDSGESIYFARQLEHIKAKAYDVIYPEFMALSMIPVSFDAGSGAETITYRQYDEVGMAKISSNYADDLPRSDVKGQEFTAKVRSIVGAFGYSIQDIRRGMQAGGVPLEQRKANSARKSNDQLVNSIAWYGDDTHGLQGLLFAANVTKGALTTGDWLNAGRTPDQIIADVSTLLAGIQSTTKGTESAKRVLIPVDEYAKISSMPRSATTDTTVLEFLKKVWPEVEFVRCPEMGLLTKNPVTGAVAATKVICAYDPSPDKLQLEIPQPYEQFPAQERNLEFVVPCHSRCGGVTIYYPKAVSIGVL
jgi:hypothetical protein